MKNKIFVVMAVFNIVVCSVVYARGINQELSQSLLRMHIIANSNSEYDQKIKLEVRDELVNILSDEGYSTREDVIRNLNTAQENINLFLNKKNIGYTCDVRYEKSKFPLKKYEDIMMPSGDYECVKVILGDGIGENWWCIAYPPMCFTKSVTGRADDEISSLLKEETYNIIASDKNEYKIKFKIVDVINSICNSL